MMLFLHLAKALPSSARYLMILLTQESLASDYPFVRFYLLYMTFHIFSLPLPCPYPSKHPFTISICNKAWLSIHKKLFSFKNTVELFLHLKLKF